MDAGRDPRGQGDMSERSAMLWLGSRDAIALFITATST